MIVHVLPIRFGVSPRLEVSEHSDKFLRRISLFLFRTSSPTIHDIVWISTGYRLKKKTVKSIVQRACEAAGPGSAVIFDLGGPRFLGSVDPNICLGLCEAMSEQTTKNAKQKYVVLTAGDRPMDSRDAEGIQETIQNGTATFLFSGNGSEGQIWNRLQSKIQNPHEELRSIFSDAQPSARDLISKKVIRHLGHFQFHEGSDAYPVFYDFSNCEREIAIACSEFLASRKIEPGKTRIFYDCSVCPWFKKAVEGALAENGLEDYGCPITMPESKEFNFDRYSILMLPICRSGKTLGDLLSEHKGPKPYVWCLIDISQENGAVHQPEEGKGGSRQVKYKAIGKQAIVTVNSYLQFHNSMTELNPLWNKLELPYEKHLEVEINDEPLSASAMWAMIVECGLGKEKYGPEGDRKLLYAIPNFDCIMKRNANLLAGKIVKYCERAIEEPLPENVIYLCLDEACARTISQRLVDSDYDRTIYVDRLLAEKFGKDKPDTEYTVRQRRELKKQERELRETIDDLQEVFGDEYEDGIQIVALDEFVYTGSTVDSINRFCKVFGLQLKAHISIASLAGVKQSWDGFLVKSFYEFGFPLRQNVQVMASGDD